MKIKLENRIQRNHGSRSREPASNNV